MFIMFNVHWVAAESIFPISIRSSDIDLYCFSFRKSVLYKSSIQYCDSRHSFAAMYIFEAKSALLIADCASEILVPMLVPERSSCLLRTNSLLSSHNHLYKLTILIAKFILLVFKQVTCLTHN